MAEVSWTAEAVRWLKDIHDYIAEDSPDAAARVVESIHRKVEALAEYPQLGQRYKTRTGADTRLLLYGHDRIAYVIKPSGDIDVLGVFHGALDIDQYLL
ncbi:MAG: type II toxin-antitoxin system RelE/ParE family toxin [Planctomycetota bacterium]